MFTKSALAAAALCLVSAGGQAATLQATGVSADDIDFSISFDDNDGNGLVGFSEVTGFSGYATLDTIVALGTAPGYVDETDKGAELNGNCGDDYESPSNWVTWWEFTNGTSTAYTCPTKYTYEIIEDETSAVPLPAGFPLLLTGFGALAIARRRRRAA
ncbi:VPLPA-CTERM sorting domain-containing protein [Aquicoccus sp. SCR17]|nr:VPLPA-CTERM sorting domain-containing protein [Carideicomes alvinocaridis]